MAVALTTAQDALVDPDLAALFERHSQWPACLICGGPAGPECDACLLIHDQKMRRAEDI